MNIGEKLKAYRKENNLTQEAFAEILNVSRQAITKWESNIGIPDIENLNSISIVMNVSLDSLINNTVWNKENDSYIYKSNTEYDIGEIKNFDISLNNANNVIVEGVESEKLKVSLLSNKLSNLEKDIKIKLDDIKNKIDLDIYMKENIIKSDLLKELDIKIQLPKYLIKKIELKVKCQNISLKNFQADNVEIDGKIEKFNIENAGKVIEINCNLDMEIKYKGLCEKISINQVNGNSSIKIDKDEDVVVEKKGIGNSICFFENGKQVDSFSNSKATNYIELNGIKSELIISRGEKNV